MRKITIKTQWDGYGRENVKRDVGESYTVVLWHEDEKTVQGEVTVMGTGEAKVSRDLKAKAVNVIVSVEADDVGEGITIVQVYQVHR